MPRAIVTGGAGFIGSALIRALAAEGYDVRVVDDLSSGDAANLDGTGAELRVGDVRDLDLLTEAARGCDVLFHLAAGAGVVESMNDPLTNFDQNARGTLTALEAARRAGVPRLVFSSSNAPLGENAYPASEEKPVAPLSPYGASKAAGEAYCSAFYGAYGMEAVVVRFSNAYGPRSAHKGNVIPLFIRRLRAGEDLVVFGDGSQTRDFVFCEDLAAGLIAAARTPGRRRPDLPARKRRRDDAEPAARAARPDVGDHAARAPRAAPAGRDPAQLLAHRQGPGRARLRAAGRPGARPAPHLGLVRYLSQARTSALAKPMP